MCDLESTGAPDLSPFEVKEVEYEGLRLRLKEAMRLKPQLKRGNPQFVGVECPSLGLDAFAGTVRGLLVAVAEDLVVLWKNYAMASDAHLSPKALELKGRLLAAMEEVAVGKEGHA